MGATEKQVQALAKARLARKPKEPEPVYHFERVTDTLPECCRCHDLVPVGHLVAVPQVKTIKDKPLGPICCRCWDTGRRG